MFSAFNSFSINSLSSNKNNSSEDNAVGIVFGWAIVMFTWLANLVDILEFGAELVSGGLFVALSAIVLSICWKNRRTWWNVLITFALVLWAFYMFDSPSLFTHEFVEFSHRTM